MTIVLAVEEQARVGARVEGAYGRAAGCAGCPLQRLCRSRAEGSFGLVRRVRDAPWKPCRVYGRVRAVDVDLYPGEGPRPPKRPPLLVVLDTNALDDDALRAALADPRFAFVVTHAAAREIRRAPWRDEVDWNRLRLVAGEPHDVHVIEARPSSKLDEPSFTDRTVMQAALDVRANILVSADRHITDAALQGRASKLGFRLHVLRPGEFVRRFVTPVTARGC